MGTLGVQGLGPSSPASPFRFLTDFLGFRAWGLGLTGLRVRVHSLGFDEKGLGFIRVLTIFPWDVKSVI